MKNFLFFILMFIVTSCYVKTREVPVESKESYSIGLKCFITSDGKEYAGFRNGVFMNVPRGTTIVASVFQIGTDSVQIIYSSPKYGNGEYTWTTSLSNYNSYEKHRIIVSIGSVH